MIITIIIIILFALTPKIHGPFDYVWEINF